MLTCLKTCSPLDSVEHNNEKEQPVINNFNDNCNNNFQSVDNDVDDRPDVESDHLHLVSNDNSISNILNINIPQNQCPEIIPEFSNSPKFLPDSTHLQDVASDLEDNREMIGLKPDADFLSNHSNFYSVKVCSKKNLDIVSTNDVKIEHLKDVEIGDLDMIENYKNSASLSDQLREIDVVGLEKLDTSISADVLNSNMTEKLDTSTSADVLNSNMMEKLDTSTSADVLSSNMTVSEYISSVNFDMSPALELQSVETDDNLILGYNSVVNDKKRIDTMGNLCQLETTKGTEMKKIEQDVDNSAGEYEKKKKHNSYNSKVDMELNVTENLTSDKAISENIDILSAGYDNNLNSNVYAELSETDVKHFVDIKLKISPNSEGFPSQILSANWCPGLVPTDIVQNTTQHLTNCSVSQTEALFYTNTIVDSSIKYTQLQNKNRNSITENYTVQIQSDADIENKLKNQIKETRKNIITVKKFDDNNYKIIRSDCNNLSHVAKPINESTPIPSEIDCRLKDSNKITHSELTYSINSNFKPHTLDSKHQYTSKLDNIGYASLNKTCSQKITSTHSSKGLHCKEMKASRKRRSPRTMTPNAHDNARNVNDCPKVRSHPSNDVITMNQSLCMKNESPSTVTSKCAYMCVDSSDADNNVNKMYVYNCGTVNQMVEPPIITPRQNDNIPMKNVLVSNHDSPIGYTSSLDDGEIDLSKIYPELNETELTQLMESLNTGNNERLPFKKRRMSVKQEMKYEPQKEEISYPATPMISIAEIEALQSKVNCNNRPFKTPAERKEMPPLPFYYNVNSEPSPIITDQFNINNHTYNNPTINYHMGNLPMPFIPCASYFPLPPIILPFNNLQTFDNDKAEQDICTKATDSQVYNPVKKEHKRDKFSLSAKYYND